MFVLYSEKELGGKPKTVQIKIIHPHFTSDHRGCRLIFKVEYNLPFSCLSAKQGAELKHFFLNQIFLGNQVLRSHFSFATMRKNNARLATYGREGANSTTEQLISSSRPSDFKIQSLVKLAEFIRCELNANDRFRIRRNDPPAEKILLKETVNRLVKVIGEQRYGVYRGGLEMMC